jgi:hypothetical protein
MTIDLVGQHFPMAAALSLDSTEYAFLSPFQAQSFLLFLVPSLNTVLAIPFDLCLG